jgi:hypothetical protein
VSAHDYEKPTGNKRHNPRIIRTGWFKKEVVMVLQEEVHVKGELPDSQGYNCGYQYDKVIWRDVQYACTN